MDQARGCNQGLFRSVFSGQLYLSSVFRGPCQFGVCVFVFAGRVHPCGDRTSRHSGSYSTIRVARVNVLSIRTKEFRNSGNHFCLPSFFMYRGHLLKPVRTCRGLRFQGAVKIFSPTTNGVSVLAFIGGRHVRRFLLASLRVVRRPPNSSSLANKELSGPRILACSSMVPCTATIRPSYPFLSSRLTIYRGTISTFHSRGASGAFRGFLTFFPIKITAFQGGTRCRERNGPFVNCTRRGSICVRLPRLPINPIRTRRGANLSEGRQRGRANCSIGIGCVLNGRSLRPSRIKVLICDHERHVDRFIRTSDLRRARYVRRRHRRFCTYRVRALAGILLRGQRSLIGFSQILRVDDFRRGGHPGFSFGLLVFESFYGFGQLGVGYLATWVWFLSSAGYRGGSNCGLLK